MVLDNNSKKLKISNKKIEINKASKLMKRIMILIVN